MVTTCSGLRLYTHTHSIDRTVHKASSCITACAPVPMIAALRAQARVPKVLTTTHRTKTPPAGLPVKLDAHRVSVSCGHCAFRREQVLRGALVKDLDADVFGKRCPECGQDTLQAKVEPVF